MKSEARRNEILALLKESKKPLSGGTLSETFGVTRQIIVKDIAILKAEGHNIASMSRGYMLADNKSFVRTFKVMHDSSSIERELQIIVDLGGKALNTAVEHPVYGRLGEALNVGSRRDIKNFFDKINKSDCAPLLCLTNGVHTHDVEAESDDILDEISNALKNEGFLID